MATRKSKSERLYREYVARLATTRGYFLNPRYGLQATCKRLANGTLELAVPQPPSSTFLHSQPGSYLNAVETWLLKQPVRFTFGTQAAIKAEANPLTAEEQAALANPMPLRSLVELC